ncbi:cation/H(+) antiporter 2-like [Pistacia vera]|uniref:cation/H(+) antiporter 2-like n=1 Tax=Pistacia vera TaxID=55513 RepID=UPI001263A00D|nr:cation/H(+) antiporter 2-like [Pistacia vera]
MAAAKTIECPEDPFNPLITSIVQISCMLVIAHLFHLFFKPLGQPGPVSQILAGLVLSPTLLSRINKIRQFFLQDASALYYRFFAFVSRILFMFLIGLGLDIPYMRLNLRVASTISLGAFVMSIIFGGSISWFLIDGVGVTTNRTSFVLVVMILLANTASPVAIRLIDELKFDTSDIGRLAMASSVISEMSCVLVYSTYLAVSSWVMFRYALYCILLTVGLVYLNKQLAMWFAKWNRNSKYVSNAQVVAILALLVGVSIGAESFGYNSTMTGFLMGMMFPRQGKTTRTLFKKLTYSVHNFLLPIYFGYMGFNFDTRDLNTVKNISAVIFLILFSFGTKIIGTMAACYHLKIPMLKGLVLALILNLKGNFELLLIDGEIDSLTWWSGKIHRLLFLVVVVNTLISGPAVAYILKRRERYFAHINTAVESLEAESELRLLACAYEPRHASGHLVLTAAMGKSVNPYLMHLVELPKKRRKTQLMYNQLEDGGQFSDEEEYGGNDVLEINDAVDAFTLQTNRKVHQIKVVNSFANMYEDVCTGAEDLRVSIIFLPFHKHQRIDKILENSKEGYRTTNQKILRHAPCSVGLLVDRSQTGFQQPIGSESVQHVAMLFFGGSDDREALSCSKRIARNAHINLTVIRFLPSESQRVQLADASSRDGMLMMSLARNETEVAKDDTFIEDFRLRYVTTGEVGYIEKYVSNGAETVQTLRDIGETMEYSLYIVGKGGGRGRSPMTTGMSDWEECPELGTLGDLLASSDFDLKSSILIIQRHRQYSNKDIVVDG